MTNCEALDRDSDKKLAPGWGERIAEAASCLGTRKNAAEIMGVSADSLARYIREENTPPFSNVAALCLSTGASLEWLATGGGEMRIADRIESGEPQPLNATTLIDAVVGNPHSDEPSAAPRTLRAKELASALHMGARLKYARERKGLLQRAAAQCFGISARTLRAYEMGERCPDSETLLHYANLGFSIHWLITGKGPERVDSSWDFEPDSMPVEDKIETGASQSLSATDLLHAAEGNLHTVETAEPHVPQPTKTKGRFGRFSGIVDRAICIASIANIYLLASQESKHPGLEIALLLLAIFLSALSWNRIATKGESDD
jgi:transcriptional regulator with XRE-family HTH domain